MAKVNLSTMDVQSLMGPAQAGDERLLECRTDIEKQLARLDRSIGEINGQRRASVCLWAACARQWHEKN